MIESQLKGQLESATQEAEQYKVKNYVNFTLVKDLSNSCVGVRGTSKRSWNEIVSFSWPRKSGNLITIIVGMENE